LIPGSTFITVRPLNANGSESIAEAEIFLRKVCHRNNFKRSETTSWEVSWIVTLTDRELLPILYEGPVDMSFTTKMILRRFIRRHEEDLDADPCYTITAKDYKNEAETKATQEFLKTKVTDPTRTLETLRYPGTNLIWSWCNIQLSDTAKEEVEDYMRRRDRPLEPYWPMYDENKIPMIKDSDWKY
jgi:hypothetical protein